MRGCRINAVMFYAPQLFNSLGSGKSASLLSAVIIGAINAVSTPPLLPKQHMNVSSYICADKSFLPKCALRNTLSKCALHLGGAR